LSLTGSIHYVCAVSFFCALAYFCLFLFTKTKSDQPATAMKLIRNKIYRICGYAMIVCLILIFIYQIWLISIIPGLASFNPVFWLESFALWAFGISWVVKGEMIFADTPS
jgi:uncharacterized membrane protein